MLRPDLYNLPQSKSNSNIDNAWRENRRFYEVMGHNDGLINNLRYTTIVKRDDRTVYLNAYKAAGGKIKSLKRNQAV